MATLTALSKFYLEQDGPIQGCLLALREIILSQNAHIAPAWKYGMPFFCYHEKKFCYLWVHKKHKQPYLGIVEGKLIEHPNLIMEKRSRMKIMLFNPNKDLPIVTINAVCNRRLPCINF